ncbi:MAG TPA: lytic transglycosylase domain-containing protein, partial [Reyranella sp.]|nr:lytic transglycosylase domain-containing protein [Reyranella sp.]
MQLMPGTWAEMRAKLSLGDDPNDPRENILAGTAYLRLMYDRFGYPGLFAAYNAGPGRYADHLRSARALPGETRAYLAKVAAGVANIPGLPAPGAVIAKPPRNDIFFVLAGAEAPSPAGLGVEPERDAITLDCGEICLQN